MWVKLCGLWYFVLTVLVPSDQSWLSNILAVVKLGVKSTTALSPCKAQMFKASLGVPTPYIWSAWVWVLTLLLSSTSSSCAPWKTGNDCSGTCVLVRGSGGILGTWVSLPCRGLSVREPGEQMSGSDLLSSFSLPFTHKEKCILKSFGLMAMLIHIYGVNLGYACLENYSCSKKHCEKQCDWSSCCVKFPIFPLICEDGSSSETEHKNTTNHF